MNHTTVPSFPFEIWVVIAHHLWHSEMKSFLFLGTKFRLVYWSSVKGRDIVFTPSTLDPEDPSIKFVIPFIEKARSLKTSAAVLSLLSSGNTIEGLEITDNLAGRDTRRLPQFPCLRALYSSFILLGDLKRSVPYGSPILLCLSSQSLILEAGALPHYFEYGVKYLLYASSTSSIDLQNLPDNLQDRVFNTKELLTTVTMLKMIETEGRVSMRTKQATPEEWLYELLRGIFHEKSVFEKYYSYFMKRSKLERMMWMNIATEEGEDMKGFLQELDRIRDEELKE